MGVLFDWLERTGRMADTMIVLTSDHGDYLGDHWMGEKTFFHDPAVRVPLIVYDPSAAADATRGTACDALVQSIDLLPTFVQCAGGDPAAHDHLLEGRSLLPLLHGTPQAWDRDFVVSEYDYSMRPLADHLGLDTAEAQIVMLATRDWKLIHFGGGFRPMLFDLRKDPRELCDLGESAAHESVIAELTRLLAQWAQRPSQRTTIPTADLRAKRQRPNRRGIVLGAVRQEDADPELTVKYRNRVVAPWQSLRGGGCKKPPEDQA